MSESFPRYAQLSNNTVLVVIESETDPDGTNGEWVACGDAGPGWVHSGGVFTPPAAVLPPWYWLVDIGPFTDRMGLKKLAVDMSTDPYAQAFSRDLDRRKWVDLKDPRVAGTLAYLAGTTIPGIGTIAAPILTPVEVNSILTTVPVDAENLALRKLYFAS